MKKRTFCLLLSISMLLSLLAPGAFAADPVATLVIDGEASDYYADGSTTGAQALQNAWADAQGKTAELILHESVDLADAGALRMENAGSDITLRLENGATLRSGSGNGAVIYIYNGSLTVAGGSVKNDMAGSSYYGVFLTGGSLTVSQDAAVSGGYYIGCRITENWEWARDFSEKGNA